MENYKVHIKNVTGTILYDVLIYRSTPTGSTILLTHLGDEVELPKYGAYAEPTFRISDYMLPMLMEAMIEKGVKPPDKAFNEGKLEATERHLDDMRTLVFKDYKKPINEK